MVTKACPNVFDLGLNVFDLGLDLLNLTLKGRLGLVEFRINSFYPLFDLYNPYSPRGVIVV